MEDQSMHASSAMGEEEKFMRMALAEARKGFGKTHPNPAVGAVIVKDGQVLSKGWHRSAGDPHAEIEALRALKNTSGARGATLFVTLEPCSTQGRTPPCTRAIINAGLAKVIYGANDPNPRHAGRARGILQSAGIQVISGLLAEECRMLNEVWNKWISTGLPFVIAKVGMSLDGRIASPPGRRWITSPQSRKDAMALRAQSGAIIVGAETIRVDNPKLTVRGHRGIKQPWRVILSRTGSIPPESRVLTDRYRARTLVYRKKSLRSVLRELGHRGVQQVLIEGGGNTLGDAFDRSLVDRVVIYLAPIVIGGPVPAIGGIGVKDHLHAIRLQNVSYRLLGGDLRIEGIIIK